MSRLMLKSFNRSIHHSVSLCCRMSSNQAQTTQMNEHSNDLWLFNYPCITPHSALQPSHILKSCRVVKSLMVLNSVTSRIQMSGVTVSHSANIASWRVLVEGENSLYSEHRRQKRAPQWDIVRSLEFSFPSIAYKFFCSLLRNQKGRGPNRVASFDRPA